MTRLRACQKQVCRSDLLHTPELPARHRAHQSFPDIIRQVLQDGSLCNARRHRVDAHIAVLAAKLRMAQAGAIVALARASTVPWACLQRAVLTTPSGVAVARALNAQTILGAVAKAEEI